ncbi:MAG: endonuclease/exonuclease/phosphatase family protein [Patulibacter sp.]
MPELRVASWNLFHGRAVPAMRSNLLPQVAAVLADADWEVCGLQELPPWWARSLAQACGASLRVARTSLARGVLPAAQRRLCEHDPELLGARGAAVNALLVRPSAGWIVDHRVARLRRVPQRRSVQAVQLARPGARTVWVANAHTHNRPLSAATGDLARAIGLVQPWASTADAAILLGDFNVPAAIAKQQAPAGGLRWLAGERVDHLLVSAGVQLAAPATAEWPQVAGTRAQAGTQTQAAGHLSDHRLLAATLTLPA